MDIQHLLQEIVDNPSTSLAIIFNLIIIESLLSVDNAAVLATMVLDLPAKDRKKALHYGIIGAYVFRGICLLLASVLIKIWWLKPLGGVYLAYLCIRYFVKRPTVQQIEAEAIQDEKSHEKAESWIYRRIVKFIGPFWSTVILIELVDLTFSIDNVFAAVAFTDNIILVWLGVFIGILAMRYVARGFVKLIEHYPFLETAAFVVIGFLGLKLMLSLYEHYAPQSAITKMLTSHEADWATSIITICIFGIPILGSLLFNYPKKR
ncbi:MAG TPA: TerC family protein [Flavipsychrobacter sp.]|nr:TerC family protein [Flavipsychrobacter sp.]